MCLNTINWQLPSSEVNGILISSSVIPRTASNADPLSKEQRFTDFREFIVTLNSLYESQNAVHLVGLQLK